GAALLAGPRWRRRVGRLPGGVDRAPQLRDALARLGDRHRVHRTVDEALEGRDRVRPPLEALQTDTDVVGEGRHRLRRARRLEFAQRPREVARFVERAAGAETSLRRDERRILRFAGGRRAEGQREEDSGQRPAPPSAPYGPTHEFAQATWIRAG